MTNICVFARHQKRPVNSETLTVGIGERGSVVDVHCLLDFHADRAVRNPIRGVDDGHQICKTISYVRQATELRCEISLYN